MARGLRVISVTPGVIVGGKFRPNPKGTVKLGSGKRFEKCVEEVTARGGAQDPKAVCAKAGIRKYGKKRMEKWAQKARNPRKASASVRRVGGSWYMFYSSPGGSGSAKASSKREAQQWAKEYRAIHRPRKARNPRASAHEEAVGNTQHRDAALRLAKDWRGKGYKTRVKRGVYGNYIVYARRPAKQKNRRRN